MKILIYSLVFPPDGVSTAQLLGEISQDLAAEFEVEVVTTRPHYNVDTGASERQPIVWKWHRLYGTSTLGPVKVTHLNMPGKAPGSAARILQWTWFHAGSLLLGLRKEADVALTVSPPPTVALVCAALRKLGGPPFLFCVWELYPDILIPLGKVKADGKPFALLKRLERLTYRAADHVAFLHQGMLDQATATYQPLAAKSSVIPTFADTNELIPQPRATALRASLELSDEHFVVGYAGNIGAAQSLDILIEAAGRLSGDQKIAFIIAGDGHDRERLQQMVASSGLENVHFTGHLPYSEVPEIYATFDLSVVALGPSVAAEALPSKVYRTMACGRPVLAIADDASPLARFVTDNAAGFTVSPKDPSEVAKMIAELASDLVRTEAAGATGREVVVSQFSRSAVTQKIRGVLQTLSGQAA